MFHRETTYVRKYWTKYLLNVQPGNPEVLAALNNFQPSTVEPPLTTEEIKAVRAWLEVRT